MLLAYAYMFFYSSKKSQGLIQAVFTTRWNVNLNKHGIFQFQYCKPSASIEETNLPQLTKSDISFELTYDLMMTTVPSSSSSSSSSNQERKDLTLLETAQAVFAILSQDLTKDMKEEIRTWLAQEKPRINLMTSKFFFG